MKVTRIEIKDFNQFKNLDIDLTYPKGHAKEGQPLDKVCFIGQSGTGKTTLLRILNNFIFYASIDLLVYNFKEIAITNRISDFQMTQYLYRHENNTLSGSYSYPDDESKDFYESDVSLYKKRKLINFPADLKFEDKKKINTHRYNNISEKNIIDFNEDNISEIWDEILEEVIKYRETILILKNQISDMATSGHTGFYKTKLESAIQNYNDWIANNINPIYDLANNCLDNLLTPFKLKIKREFEFTKKEDIGFIKIEDLNGNEVPFDLWSTGTRQLLYSTLPLYLLKPENTIILFDEPERSLYPDMQRMIIDFYSSLTKDSQFFYATHSPIIASSFEPWEIVELKLDENGNVFQDLYYKGERHIDNYTIYPQYLDYDTMLRNVFDLEETVNQERIDKIGDALMYKKELKKLREKGDTTSDNFKKLYKDYKKLSEQLGYKGFEVF